MSQTDKPSHTTSSADLQEIIAMKRAIVYLSVDWSGQERLSRPIVTRLFNELGLLSSQTFLVDCSDKNEDILSEIAGCICDNRKELKFGGFGETIFLVNGKLIDFIKNPGQLGYEKTRETLLRWDAQQLT